MQVICREHHVLAGHRIIAIRTMLRAVPPGALPPTFIAGVDDICRAQGKGRQGECVKQLHCSQCAEHEDGSHSCTWQHERSISMRHVVHPAALLPNPPSHVSHAVSFVGPGMTCRSWQSNENVFETEASMAQLQLLVYSQHNCLRIIGQARWHPSCRNAAPMLP